MAEEQIKITCAICGYSEKIDKGILDRWGKPQLCNKCLKQVVDQENKKYKN